MTPPLFSLTVVVMVLFYPLRKMHMIFIWMMLRFKLRSNGRIQQAAERTENITHYRTQSPSSPPPPQYDNLGQFPTPLLPSLLYFYIYKSNILNEVHQKWHHLSTWDAYTHVQYWPYLMTLGHRVCWNTHAERNKSGYTFQTPVIVKVGEILWFLFYRNRWKKS